MKLADLLEGLSVTELAADPQTEIAVVCYDSRKAWENSLFVAVRGYVTDGHKFISTVAAQGCAVCVCEEKPTVGIPYVIVPDSRLALALIGANFYHHPAERMTMIGVTGTNGKTTSTILLKHVLEHCLGAKVGLIGTNRNLIGDEEVPTERTTPESLDLQELLYEMVEKGCSHVVMEVSSHSLYLYRVAGITYEVGVFTNLTRDHLDFHKTMENYAAAKALLFSKQSRRAVINADDIWGAYMTGQSAGPVLTYGIEQPADLRASRLIEAADRVSYTMEQAGKNYDVTLKIPGRFSVYNSLDVIGCGLALGLPAEEIIAALADAEGVKGRVEVVPTDGDYAVIIDYAHTPDALENVLNTMRPLCRARLVALFGCGGDRDRTKRPMMAEIAGKLADFVIVTSDNPRTEEPQAIIEDILPGLAGSETPYVSICDRGEAIAYALDMARSGDIIVLAGKGHETYQEINHVKHHMDEREIVAEHLAARKV